MDLGNGVFFVEETSLALAPGVPYDVLKQRLQQRLDQRGVQITEVIHEEFCLFPMNLPLPDRNVSLMLAFGGAASMVHPASGYMVGSLLRTGARLWLRHMAEAHCESKPWVQRPWHNGVGRRSGLSSWCFVISSTNLDLGRLMGFQRSACCAPISPPSFALPREEWFGFLTNTLAFAALDGRDAAPVCDVSLGAAAGFGAGRGSGSSSAVLKSQQLGKPGTL